MQCGNRQGVTIMDYAVKLRNVTKRFKETTAVEGVTVSFEIGKIYGIIGRNGSGKTVLFKCICGLLAVTEGEITVLESPHFSASGNEDFLLVEALPQSPQNTGSCSGNAGKSQRLRDFANR